MACERAVPGECWLVQLVSREVTAIFHTYPGLFLTLCLSSFLVQGGESSIQQPPGINRYEFREVHDPDGIGKFYMGREIAQVMGHEGADWLERPERAEEEQPDKMLKELHLKPGDVVADIGAGTGYISRRLALRVAPRGKVLAEDIQPEMLNLLTNQSRGLGITNIVPVLGTESDANLPAGSADLVLMVDVYHEFKFPYEMMAAICRSLRPGGRVVFVEFRAEDPGVPIKRVHKMTEAQVKKEMSVLPLRWLETLEALPRQHIVVFGKQPD
jgi:ubiquinone/menaquinone biosynthesis C-methylase UbiE